MAKKQTGCLWLVGHGHIDMNWLWQFPETVQCCQDTFAQVLRFMAEFKDFRYSQSQACIYEVLERLDPELFRRIRTVVRAGKWNLTGGMWSEADSNLSSGEALVRSCLLGQEYFRAKFGRQAKVGWLPDNFGHTAQLPQILGQAEMDGYFFIRCRPGPAYASEIDAWGGLTGQIDRVRVPGDIFWWEAADGSRVLAKHGPTYNDIIVEAIMLTIFALFFCGFFTRYFIIA